MALETEKKRLLTEFARAGVSVQEFCLHNKIAERTFYRWRETHTDSRQSRARPHEPKRTYTVRLTKKSRALADALVLLTGDLLSVVVERAIEQEVERVKNEAKIYVDS